MKLDIKKVAKLVKSKKPEQVYSIKIEIFGDHSAEISFVDFADNILENYQCNSKKELKNTLKKLKL